MALYDYTAYVDKYDDITKLWNTINSDTSSAAYKKWHPLGASTKEAFGKLHYDTVGKGAGRKLPDPSAYPSAYPTTPTYTPPAPGGTIDEIAYGRSAVSGAPRLGVAPTIASPAQRTPGVEELVEYRMSQMMRQENPYTQQAIKNTKQYYNKRGVLNTSMAASAGVDAAVKSMLPIAQQDAAMIHSQAIENQRVVNQFLMEDYKTKMTFRLTEYGHMMNTYNSGLQRSHEKNENSIERAWKAEQNMYDRELNIWRDKYRAEVEKIAAMSACHQNAMSRWSATVAAIESTKEKISTEYYNQSIKNAAKTRDAELRSCTRR
tara:strand:- start:4793 stop:5749 length:957 start_codon:yes stop_codon:yes gene_type:complete